MVLGKIARRRLAYNFESGFAGAAPSPSQCGSSLSSKLRCEPELPFVNELLL